MIHNIKRFLVVLLFFSISFISFGFDPDPPPPPPCPTGDNNEVGAPIENGIPIILGLALFYGAFKFQQARRKLKEAENEG